MKNSNKKGFTIVELVIVIAVIAILAAVLIPTFNNLVKKANLSSDKQAVRQMNEALIHWESIHGYANKPADVESAMNILEEAGFNAENWVCLTSDYQVWWSQKLNRCVLYNSTTTEVEYPEEYSTKETLNAENGWFIYNANHIKAQQFDLKLGSATGATGKTTFASANRVSDSNTTSVSNADANLTAIDNVLKNSDSNLKTVLGNSVHVFATKEKVSAISGNATKGAFASLQVASVSKNSNPVTVKDSVTGKDNLAENFYYITIVQNGTPDTEDVKKASLAAGEFVYNIFDQITTGKIPSDVTILIDTSKGDVTLDVSRCEWAPCNTFTGYFGTTDPNHKVIIDGARLTKQTGYANTVVFEGSEAKAADGTRRSKYFITGFFGVVYGKTTIENVTFKNLSIAEPGKDFQIAINNTSRNTVGVIGGICDGNGSNIANEKVDVKLNNIIVESSCSVKGAASVGGLVGYVGRSGGSNEISGNISITNCHVKCDVTSTNEPNPNGYHPIGGMIGYVVSTSAATRHNKNGGLNITLDNCSYSGTLTGNNSVGAVLGDNTDWATGTLTIKGGDYSGAKFASTNNARNSRNAALVRYTCGSADIGTFIKTEGDIKFNTEFPAFITSSGKYKIDKTNFN